MKHWQQLKKVEKSVIEAYLVNFDFVHISQERVNGPLTQHPEHRAQSFESCVSNLWSRIIHLLQEWGKVHVLNITSWSRSTVWNPF